MAGIDYRTTYISRFVEPDLPQHLRDERVEHLAALTPDELRDFEMIERYTHPVGALALAQDVMDGNFARDEAYKIANNMHYSVGHYRDYQPVYAVFVEMAANKALAEVSVPDGGYNAFEYLGNLSLKGDTFALNASFPAEGTLLGEQFTDPLWARSGQADCAANAAMAWACGAESLEPAPGRLLEFWRWWLTEAIPQAWTKAEE
jgi:hypothetical protein